MKTNKTPKQSRNTLLPRSANRSKYQPKVASKGETYPAARNQQGFRSRCALKTKQIN